MGNYVVKQEFPLYAEADIKIQLGFMRYDADIAIQYRLTSYIKFIAGYKNNIYIGSGNYTYKIGSTTYTDIPIGVRIRKTDNYTVCKQYN